MSARNLAATVRTTLDFFPNGYERSDALAALAALEQQTADAQAELENADRMLVRERTRMYAERQRAGEEHAARVRAEEALRQIAEATFKFVSECEACPTCDGSPEDGHDDGCLLATLAAAGADTPKRPSSVWDSCSCDRTYHDECPDHGVYGAGLGPSGKRAAAGEDTP